MSGVNRVTLVGNLGQKPEVTFLPSGQAVCKMSLATNEQWTDKDGNKQEKVEWHRIVVWGKMGESCGKYLDKGRQVYIEGRITTRSWDDKESGEKRWMTEIVATNVTFLGGGNGTRRDEGPPHDESEAPPAGRRSSSPPGSGGEDFGPPPGDDDIPFGTSDMRAGAPYSLYRGLRSF